MSGVDFVREVDENVPAFRERLEGLIQTPPIYLLLALLVLISAGLAVQFSAAGGSGQPWFWPHAIRALAGCALMVGVALVDIRVWLRFAYIPLAITLALLLALEFIPSGLTVDRWIRIGSFQFQPSEPVKLALVLALARFFHDRRGRGGFLELVVPGIVIAVPAFLVWRQPDLGTAAAIVAVGCVTAFQAGLSLRVVVAGTVAAVGALPLLWWFVLHEYQRVRVRSFLDPESDPLGAGYHLLQSKIAVGSGGAFGRGFLGGSQTQLAFLPEHHTDFAFTVFAEEFGFAGALALVAIYALIIVWGVVLAQFVRNHFGRVLAASITFIVFLYAFINISMTTGTLPVVGYPLPPISYGGTAMLTLFACMGLLLNVYVHRDSVLGRRSQTVV
ncbi:MAG: rod shape-determining protein RodA [Alphaproteobacteria bacterium]|nr:rod shape-determining protein RodA [Alphaproteobacteria bacterium]